MFIVFIFYSHDDEEGQGIAYEAIWATKMEPWAAQWAQAETDVHDYEGLYDESTYGPYLRWYHGVTMLEVLPSAC